MDNITAVSDGGFENFEKLIHEIEDRITKTVHKVMGEVRVPIQVELSDVSIRFHEANAIGDPDRSYHLGKAEISASLNIKR